MTLCYLLSGQSVLGLIKMCMVHVIEKKKKNFELFISMWYPVVMFLLYSLSQLEPHVVHYGRVDSATNTLKFRLSRPCNAGQECCLSYGNFPSSHLITFYGFVPQGDNLYDVIPLGEFYCSISLSDIFYNWSSSTKCDIVLIYLHKPLYCCWKIVEDLCSIILTSNISHADIDAAQDDFTEGSSISNWTTHMVRATWLSHNCNIFYYGLPSPFLDCLRRARSPMPHTKDLVIFYAYLCYSGWHHLHFLLNIFSLGNGIYYCVWSILMKCYYYFHITLVC